MIKSAVIFDIDGTVFNNSHRAHHLKSAPKDWASFNATMHLDPPFPAIVKLNKILHMAGHCILFVTGREEVFHAITEIQFIEHDIYYDEIYMRPKGDRREDTVTKLEALHQLRADGYEPWLVIEDRARLVKMWREQGLTCLQPADGDF